MSTEVMPNLQLRIAHVLFIDLVGYSKLLIDDQREILGQLNEVIRGTPHFREADAARNVIPLPSGDGMALVFLSNPEDPVECALEVSDALQHYPKIKLRMGVHSGAVSGVTDVNERSIVAGAGINMAQRVMDLGDAGHILLSKRAAEDLLQYRQWEPYLHYLGECEVKHGVHIKIFNLYADKLGNPQLPEKLKLYFRKQAASRRLKQTFVAGLALIAIALSMALVLLRRTPPKLPANSAALVPNKSIAVLPFENLSEDKANAYFAAGIQDEILTRLAKLHELKVISRTSTEKYQSQPKDLKTVGAELGVANILEGSVQKLANDVHINVQLIKAPTDEHLWAQSYDRTLDHVFTVEGEVAQTVADALKVTLLPAQIEKLNALPTRDPKAYDLFLRGEYAFNQAWKNPGDYQETLKLALTHFRDAVTADPQFALAFAQLAQTELTQYHFGLIDGGATRMPQVLASAKGNIDRALRLEPDLATAHAALGRWHYWGQDDNDAGRTEFKRALAIDPRLSDASLGMAAIAITQGRPEEAIEQLSKVLEFDPRNFRVLRNLAIAYEMRRDYARATELFSRAVTLDPADEFDASNLMESIIREKGDIGAASRVYDSLPAELQNHLVIVEKRVNLLMLAREFAAAKKIVQDRPPESWRTEWRRPQLLGEIQRALGQKDPARESFQQARTLLTGVIAKDPKEPLTHASLGLVEASLGNADEALREAQGAIDLQPVEKNPFRGLAWWVFLAQVNARLGRAGDAANLIERLLRMPNTGEAISLWELKLDPRWDPLRGDPRFKKIVASVGAKKTK
jgi:serine/threonine-protein kinase